MKTKYYVEKGTICNYSQKGHYNFIYPDEKRNMFGSDSFKVKVREAKENQIDDLFKKILGD